MYKESRAGCREAGSRAESAEKDRCVEESTGVISRDQESGQKSGYVELGAGNRKSELAEVLTTSKLLCCDCLHLLQQKESLDAKPQLPRVGDVK